MSKTTSFGYTDTAAAGGATKTFTRPNLNWPTDFVVTSEGDSKCLLSNKTSPLDQLERIRVESSNIADVYKGTSIDPTVYAPSRQGTSIVCQVVDVLRVTDSALPSFQVDLPISAHIVLKVPLSTYVTADNVLAVAGRALSCLFDNDVTTNSRVAAMLRGSMTPAGL